MTKGTRSRVMLWAIGLWLCLTAVAVAEQTAAPTPPPAPKVAVKLLESTTLDPGIASALTDVLCARLADKSPYRVLCASDVAAILTATQQTALIGSCDDDSCYEALGKALETDLLLVGSIAKVGKLYVISLSLIKTADKTITARVSHEVSGDEGRLIDGVRAAVDKLLAARS